MQKWKCIKCNIKINEISQPTSRFAYYFIISHTDIHSPLTILYVHHWYLNVHNNKTKLNTRITKIHFIEYYIYKEILIKAVISLEAYYISHTI